ncbi:GroES-like protein [Aaosphaeria arxii CBS 175.79]|uniref:GroES-like protein n=1 Tax=Aaosphaeria arxii CBS 175.79 TaxID=1450172 RepID=A0A6A5XM95_9PLEO|nr:GroES-like protein [Aaosphaeria arxii CBS 175.79]KAF2014073.1 GroES-like protein [Aaosphaeria arxii CBS 175.79]
MVSLAVENMLAAQYNQKTNGIEINQVPIPVCGDNDILIKTKCASLCHSDLMLFWGHTTEKPPTDKITIGHENTGYVVTMGKNVQGFKVGDAVGCLGCSYACYECEGCQVHNIWCEKGTGRLHGFQCDGHFAEYSIADYRNAMVLPLGMELVTAAPLFCAGITAYHAIKGCDLKPDQWIAIVGCGGLGHLAVQYAKALGLKVVGLDISESQLQAVEALGADMVINTLTEPDFETKVKTFTKGGCNAAAVFSASNVAYENAPKTLRINGLLMVAGIPKQPLAINALDILLGKYRVAGKSSGIPQNMPEAIEFSHKHGIQSHITTFNDIHDIQKAVDLMTSGKTAGRLGVVFE